MIAGLGRVAASAPAVPNHYCHQTSMNPCRKIPLSSLLILALGLIIPRVEAIPVWLFEVDLTGAIAEQSSDYDAVAFPAANALDGEFGNFTHTADNDPDPWWSVTLAGPQAVSALLLYNRPDCCQDRLQDVTVEAFASAEDDTPVFSDMFNIGNGLQSPATLKIDFGEKLTVQKIVIRIPSPGYLSLGEVRLLSDEVETVLQHGTNLTHADIATLTPNQSTVGYGSGPGFAIDGNYQNFTHTETSDSEPYWEVDFGSPMSFQRVVLFNRTSCCQLRLRDITVSVLDGDFNEIWVSPLLNELNIMNSPAQLICNIQQLNGGVPVVGRIVRVARMGLGSTDDENALSLAEVDIIGGSPGTEVPAVDSDGDGMPDEWEAEYDLDPNNPADAALDADNDTLTNLQEYQRGTNPRLADSDGDGLSDAVETATGEWVSATDTGTSPFNPDSDGDGLLDGLENPDLPSTGLSQPGSDPNQADTDEDGWDDATEAAFGSDPKVAASVPTLEEGLKLLAYWPLDDASQPTVAKEVVRGLNGAMEGGAAYTEDGGGHSGEAGDRAVDFGTTQPGSTIRVLTGRFLNLTSTEDQITISFWQKLHEVANSWPFSAQFVPPGGGDTRGLGAHATWSNGNFYWDTAGCCEESLQRVWGPNPGADLLEWHHLLYLKNGELKQIWLDGELIIEGFNSHLLPDTFTTLFIGSSNNGAENTLGIIDDFALFGSALDEDAIQQLASGVSPLALGSPPVTPVTFAITQVTFTDGTLALTWDSTAGSTYVVERSEALAATGWADIATLTATATSTTWTDTVAPLPATKTQYFYRVRQNP